MQKESFHKSMTMSRASATAVIFLRKKFTQFVHLAFLALQQFTDRQNPTKPTPTVQALYNTESRCRTWTKNTKSKLTHSFLKCACSHGRQSIWYSFLSNDEHCTHHQDNVTHLSRGGIHFQRQVHFSEGGILLLREVVALLTEV